MNSIKIILLGIILILTSLFFMGICIIRDGGPELLSLCLFVLGIIISIIGLFKRDDQTDEDNESDQ